MARRVPLQIPSMNIRAFIKLKLLSPVDTFVKSQSGPWVIILVWDPSDMFSSNSVIVYSPLLGPVPLSTPPPPPPPHSLNATAYRPCFLFLNIWDPDMYIIPYLPSEAKFHGFSVRSGHSTTSTCTSEKFLDKLDFNTRKYLKKSNLYTYNGEQWELRKL